MPLVIFDLDGTLIDSRSVMETAFREAFAVAVGRGEPPLVEFYRLLGDSFPNILTRLGLPAAMAPIFKSTAQRLAHCIVPVPEAISACVELNRLGVPMAILTGKDRERTEEILDLFDISGLFQAVAAGSDGFAPKPAPDGVELLCEQLDSGVSETVVVGDSAFDILAGNRAGAVTVGCAWGMGSKEELTAADPDHLLLDPGQLLSLLLAHLGQFGVGRGAHALE